MSDVILTAEAVTAGHPDKLCDRISDAIVDAHLHEDPAARVVAETALAGGVVFLAMMQDSDAAVDGPAVARLVIREAGYTEGRFAADSAAVMTSLIDLPPAPRSRSAAARQACTLFGYACRETPALMPLPVMLANALAAGLDRARSEDVIAGLSPDGQVQAAIAYDGHRPVRIAALSITARALPGGTLPGNLDTAIREQVIAPVLKDFEIEMDGAGIWINPDPDEAGGGPAVHAGLTGRKMAADTYGGSARTTTSALSGKDPARIDRAGVYAARQAAKSVVAAGLAERCEVQLSYMIGRAEPVSLAVDCFGTGKEPDDTIARRLRNALDLTPQAILTRLRLALLPAANGGRFYAHLSAYGQLGRQLPVCPWEEPVPLG